MLTIAHYQYPNSKSALAMKTTSALLQRNPNKRMNVRSDREPSAGSRDLLCKGREK